MVLRARHNPILELLFPSNACCLGCGDETGMDSDWLCLECKKLLYRMDITFSASGRDWPKNGVSLARGVYRYRRPVIGLIHAFKYDGVYSIAELLTQEMATSLLEWNEVEVDYLVPIPMNITRERKRGYNQTDVLSSSLSKRTGIPVLNALKRVINTKQQALSTDSQRRSNMKGAFALIRDVQGMNLMLIDDVLTSGATANACAAVLRDGGAKDVNLLTIASAKG